MIVTKITIGVALALYAFLWYLALHGVSSLIGVLATPPILAVLVAILVAFQRFMGFKPKSPKFQEPVEKDQE